MNPGRLFFASKQVAVFALALGTLVNNATTGVVTNADTGSPNRLLYSLFF